LSSKSKQAEKGKGKEAVGGQVSARLVKVTRVVKRRAMTAQNFGTVTRTSFDPKNNSPPASSLRLGERRSDAVDENSSLAMSSLLY